MNTDNSAPVAEPGAGLPPAHVRFWRGMRRLGPAGMITFVSGFLPPLGGFLVIGYMHKLGPMLQRMGWNGVLLYIGAYLVLGGFALAPTYSYSALGGWAFGAWRGLLYSMTAFALAGLVGYTLVRTLAGNRATNMIAEHPKWQAVYDALVRGGFWRTLWLMTLVRVPPTSPFSLANYVMGLARVPVFTFFLATILGLLPRTAIVVFAAARIRSLEVRQDWWVMALWIVVTIVVVAVIGHVARKAIDRATGVGPPPTEVSNDTLPLAEK